MSHAKEPWRDTSLNDVSRRRFDEMFDRMHASAMAAKAAENSKARGYAVGVALSAIALIAVVFSVAPNQPGAFVLAAGLAAFGVLAVYVAFRKDRPPSPARVIATPRSTPLFIFKRPSSGVCGCCGGYCIVGNMDLPTVVTSHAPSN